MGFGIAARGALAACALVCAAAAAHGQPRPGVAQTIAAMQALNAVYSVMIPCSATDPQTHRLVRADLDEAAGAAAQVVARWARGGADAPPADRLPELRLLLDYQRLLRADEPFRAIVALCTPTYQAELDRFVRLMHFEHFQILVRSTADH